MTTISDRRLRVPAQLVNIAQARDFVAQAAEAAGLGEREVYRCQVAVDEVLTNIVEHGYRGGDDALIDVECATENGRFIITIIDDSPPFDPSVREDPDPAMTLDEREPGGWGIFFIKKMMDDVSYTYQNGRNHLTLVKFLPAPRVERMEAGIRLSEVAPGVWLLSPVGRLDMTTSPSLEYALQNEFNAGHTRLVVDMSGVSYIASSGLKTLVGAWRQAKGLGGKVFLADLQPRVREVFQMVGFDQVFYIFDTVARAVEAIRMEPARKS